MSLLVAFGVLGLGAACSADGDGGGATGMGNPPPGQCVAPSCEGCTSCFASCYCLTTDLAQCNSVCGTSAGGSAGSFGTGGLGPGGTGPGGTGTGGIGTGGSGGVGGVGTGGTGNVGTGGVGGGGGGTVPTIPPAPANCPNLATGNITVSGKQVQLWVGPAGRAGPIIFYWHGTGSNSGEAGLLGPAVQEIQSGGGVIASFTTTTATGANTGNNVWYTGDFAMADQILACGVQQGVVDPRRVYTAGCSAGGLQASVMAYERSSYLAASMPNSGGIVLAYQLQDPAHVPAVISTHGGSSDVVVINFGQTTARFDTDIKAKGGFVVNCNHGGGHCQSPANVKAAQWEFAKAHPFGVTPEPYQGGLPASFPSICQIIQ
jgi:hypothetical protein